MDGLSPYFILDENNSISVWVGQKKNYQPKTINSSKANQKKNVFQTNVGDDDDRDNVVKSCTRKISKNMFRMDNTKHTIYSKDAKKEGRDINIEVYGVDRMVFGFLMSSLQNIF